MSNEIYQYGIVGVALIYALEKGYQLFKGVLAKYNPPDESSNGVKLALNKISENHLHSIEETIKEQTRNNNSWHEKQYQVLCEIKGLLQK